MRKITYYVATSVDGFIAGPNQEVDQFLPDGPLVDRYMEDLKGFDTVIMGRKTYEFGYAFGLKPGAPAYPHMRHYLFSRTLSFDDPHPLVKVVDYDLDLIKRLKAEEGTDIYLCGGGQFAGWLLDHGMIDVLKIKFNPFIFGKGIPLFGDNQKTPRLELRDVERFDSGAMILTYDIKNEN